MEFYKESYSIKFDIIKTLNLNVLLKKINLNEDGNGNGIVFLSGKSFKSNDSKILLDWISFTISYNKIKLFVSLFPKSALLRIIRVDNINVNEIISYATKIIKSFMEDDNDLKLRVPITKTVMYNHIHTIDVDKLSYFIVRRKLYVKNKYLNYKFMNENTKIKIHLQSKLINFIGDENNINDEVNNFKKILDNYLNIYKHRENIECVKCKKLNMQLDKEINKENDNVIDENDIKIIITI